MKYSVSLTYAFSVCLLTICLFAMPSPAWSQNYSHIERGRAKDMLNAVKKEIKEKYYDASFKGIEIDARFKLAEEKLSSATSENQAFGIIAQAVLELNDSHTTFYPPRRTGRVDYGIQMQMIGDKCLVTAVKPKSDAEKKGLKPGDEILTLENFRPTRKDMWKMMYYYNALSPRAGLNIKVQSPGEKEPRELNIASKIKISKAVLNFGDIYREYELSDFTVEHRFVTLGNTTIWKMPTFATEPSIVDGIMQGKIGKAANLILDLRGNGGGYVVTLERLAGYFVEKDTKIADLKARKEMKPQMAKTKGKDVYKGNLIVLIDANSGSASEIFARFVQIEKRGVVIGDQSAGAVMQSRYHPMEFGGDRVVQYGISLTMADVITTDGKSLEHIGVTPQMPLIPTGANLAAGQDPVLAVALELFGQKVTAEQAGKLFPIKWDDE